MAIASVTPDSPSEHCESVITVGVGSLCSFAAFKPTIPEEHATRRLRCQPVLDRGKKQVQAYVEKEIARKKKQVRRQFELIDGWQIISVCGSTQLCASAEFLLSVKNECSLQISKGFCSGKTKRVRIDESVNSQVLLSK